METERVPDDDIAVVDRPVGSRERFAEEEPFCRGGVYAEVAVVRYVEVRCLLAGTTTSYIESAAGVAAGE